MNVAAMLLYCYWYQFILLLVALAAGSTEMKDDISYEKDQDKCHCSGGLDCNLTTGVCSTSECDPGWDGESCRYVCPPGNFGQSCNFTCLQCKSSNCDHINGACLEGCIPGWSGLYCTEPTNIAANVDEGIEVPAVLITVAVIVAVILMLLGSLTAFICYRKRKRKRLRRIATESNTENDIHINDLALDVAYNAVKALECEVNVDRAGTMTVKDNDIDIDMFHNHHSDQVTEL